MICLLIPLLLAALAFLLRIRLRVRYDVEGFSIKAMLGPLTLLRIPKPPATGKGNPKQKKTEAEAKQKPSGGSAPGFRQVLSIIGETLGKLRPALRVDELTLWYQSASADPAAAALLFGGANAAAAALVQTLDRMFRIRKRDIRTSVSFEETTPRLYVCLSLSASAIRFGSAVLPMLLRISRSRTPKQTDTEES